MKSDPETSGGRVRLWRRLGSLVVVVGAGGVLALSAWLEPAAEGHSTHLQLGLGRCTIYSGTGVPCPMCGMTTSFALFAHFRPVAAFVNQPFATVLFALTLVAFGVGVAELLDARGRWERLSERVAPYEGRLAALFVLGMAAGWLYKIAIMRDALG